MVGLAAASCLKYWGRDYRLIVGGLSRETACAHLIRPRNLPFRSLPISANLVVDVLAESDTKVKPDSCAVHSMLAEHSGYSPAKPLTKSFRSAVLPRWQPR